MYINSEYLDYKYLVSVHDNYVTLTNKHYIRGSSGDADVIPVIYNYLDSGLVLESNESFYDSYTLNDISSIFSSDYFDLSLSSNWFICGCIIITFIIFIINNLTKLFKKGGAFGSN